MVDEIILRLLLLVPLCGAVCVAILGPKRIPAIRWVSLAATLLNLVLAFIVAVHFIDIRDTAVRKLLWTFEPEFTTVVDILPFGSTAVQFFIGVDGLNIWLIVLTALLMALNRRLSLTTSGLLRATPRSSKRALIASNLSSISSVLLTAGG